MHLQVFLLFLVSGVIGQNVNVDRQTCRSRTLVGPAGNNNRQVAQRLGDGSLLVTSIYRENDPNDTFYTRINNGIRAETRDCLEDWQEGRRSLPKPQDTEQMCRNVRLDRQARVQTSHGQFLNFQVQINGRKSPSTIAQILVQPNMRSYSGKAERYAIVRGLLASLDSGSTVWFFQQQLTNGEPLSCPNRTT